MCEEQVWVYTQDCSYLPFFQASCKCFPSDTVPAQFPLPYIHMCVCVYIYNPLICYFMYAYVSYWKTCFLSSVGFSKFCMLLCLGMAVFVFAAYWPIHVFLCKEEVVCYLLSIPLSYFALLHFPEPSVVFCFFDELNSYLLQLKQLSAEMNWSM